MPGPHEGGPTFPPPDPPPDTWPPSYPTDPNNPSDNPDGNPSPDNPPPTTDTGATDTNADFQKRLQDILAGLMAQTPKAVNPEVAQAAAVYLKLWGVAPPPGYIEGLVRGGLNLYEIVSNEVAKPAYASTKSYKDSWGGYAAQIADVFGRR